MIFLMSGMSRPRPGEVGADENVGSPVAEPVEGPFAVLLVEAAMEKTHGKSFFGKVAGGALHGVPIVEEYDTALLAKVDKQSLQCLEFILFGALHLEYFHPLSGSLISCNEVQTDGIEAAAQIGRYLLGIGGREKRHAG